MLGRRTSESSLSLDRDLVNRNMCYPSCKKAPSENFEMQSFENTQYFKIDIMCSRITILHSENPQKSGKKLSWSGCAVRGV